MKKKSYISTKFIILIPVFILGFVSVVSNILAVTNIKRVNANATQIANGYMSCISEARRYSERDASDPQTGTVPYRGDRLKYHDLAGRDHPE